MARAQKRKQTSRVAKSSKASTRGRTAKRSAAGPARHKASKKTKPAKRTKPTKSAKPAKPAKPAKRAATRSTAKKAATPRTVSSTKKTAAKPTARATKAARPAKVGAAARKKAEPFRKLLLKRHQNLMRSYQMTKGDTRMPAADGTEDYIDYAVSSYTREFSLSLTEMERDQLQLVEEALARITRGEFGRCLQCGEEIPTKRLEVEPWARHCIRCQELEERGLLEDRFGLDSDGGDAGEDERVDSETGKPRASSQPAGTKDDEEDEFEEESLSL